MTYIYTCPNCNKQVEVIKPMSESSKTEQCSECGGELERVYTASSIKTSDGIKT